MVDRTRRGRRHGCAGGWGLLALVWATGARAQDVKLAELESQALRARPVLGAADGRIAEANARVDAARSAYSPTLTLVGDVSLLPGQRFVPFDSPDHPGARVSAVFPINNSGAFNPVPRYSATLDARGNLYDFGRTSAAVDAAVAQSRAAQADATRARKDIVREVRTAYIRWATAHALAGVCERSLRAAEERLRLTAASIEEGARRKVDRTAAESDAAFAGLELDRARANLELARQDLGFIAVRDLGPDARPGDDILVSGSWPVDSGAGFMPARPALTSASTGPSAPGAPVPPVNQANPADPALLALREQRAAAQAVARVHDHAFAPVVSANAQIGVQGQTTDVFPLYRVGVNVTMPLWDGGADRANREQAAAQAAQLGAQAAEYSDQREHLRRHAEASVAQAARRIGIAEQLVRLCGTRVSQLEEGYPLGAATFAELAEARASLQRAETELVLARALRAEALLGFD